ncbi:MAG: peptidoglycan DD-metalloendopeptidase family protein [Chloroflexi bacterium]|nr:peptidoglycan DD-metalloendopeptidase family protein [Chloroflexota bacterium]
MADFDLSLVVRATEDGVVATGAKTEKALDGVAAAQGRVAAQSKNLGTATGRAASGLNSESAAARSAAAGITSADAPTRKAVREQQRLAQGVAQTSANMKALSLDAKALAGILATTAAPVGTLATKSTQAGGSIGKLGAIATGVATFMGVGFASLILIGVNALADLAIKAYNSGKEIEKAVEELKKDAKATDIARKAKAAFANTLEGVTAAIRVNRDALNELKRAGEGQAERAAKDAALSLLRIDRINAETSALINQARARVKLLRLNPKQTARGDVINPALAGAQAGLDDLEQKLQRTNIQLGLAQKGFREAFSFAVVERASKLADPLEKIKEKYEGRGGLIDLARQQASADELRNGTLTRQITLLKQKEAAELKAASATSKRDPRDPFAGRDLADFGRPVAGGSITSGYGQRARPTAGASTNHLGLDYAARLGQSIFATMDGIVKRAAGAGGYGNQIQLGHGAGTETRYSHLSRFNVREGQAVKKGDVIGFAGRTGTATGTHLHYEVLVNGKKVNPAAGKFPFDPAEVQKVADQAAERLEDFGQRAGEGIARINSQFDEQPRLIDAAAKAARDLDKIIKELGEQKPLGFKGLIEDAERAKVIVREGINRPYNDFIQSQAESLAVQKLITAGRTDEAEATRIILGLERQMGPLTPERRDAILASVQALRAEGRQLDLNREKQKKYLDQLDSVKSAVRSVFDDPIKGLKDLPKRLIAAAGQFKADQLFESLFGDTFRKLEDQITGANTAKDASDRMARAVDGVTASARRVESAFNGVAGAANGQAGGGGVDPLAPLPDGQGADVTVTGRRPTGLPQILEKLSKGVGISDAGAAKIGSIAGKGLEGAATGALTNSFLKPLGKALGFKTSQTGAQIGGAIGSFLPIPGGDIIGSIVGSIVGGLFKKTKKGSATITNVFDDPTAKGSFKKETSALASGIQDTLLNLADALGGGLGSFAVSVGKRKDKFVVDPSGRGKTKGGGTKKFDDEADAIKFAILDAIKDGAVTGLSAAVQQALKSSDDLERSLKEALKVRDLEDLIGGLGNTLSRYFKDFDRQAAERVRIAKKYGLDLVAVERINAEERAKLVESVIQSRIGSLTKFRDDMKFGDLFEGDASTRRGALLGEITKVQAQAEAGSDGAADQLANLYRQLIETSKEAFGTAGPELTSDRALAASGVDRVIEMENARIAQAQAWNEASLAAANENNTLTNETNDLLARNNALLDRMLGAFGVSSSGVASAGGGDLTMIGSGGGFSGGGGRFTNQSVELL